MKMLIIPHKGDLLNAYVTLYNQTVSFTFGYFHIFSTEVAYSFFFNPLTYLGIRELCALNSVGSLPSKGQKYF